MINETVLTFGENPPAQPTTLGMTDGQAAAIVPVLVYWSLCVMFELIEQFGLFQKHKIYPTEEEQKKNIAPKGQVIRYVMIQQTVQVIFALIVTSWEDEKPVPDDAFGQIQYFKGLLRSFHFLQPMEVSILAWCLRGTWLAVRQFAAFFVYDFWSYIVHYVEHNNQYIYKHIHSRHHHLYNPYSWGTLYNHPLEGFYLDTVGAYFGKAAAGLSHREATFFFTLATTKGTSDHCGYDLPFDPFRVFGYLSGNGLYFHNVHHQSWGLKTNFALYFTFWDRFFNTMYLGSRPLVAKKAAEKEMRQGVAVDFSNDPVPTEVSSEVLRERKPLNRIPE